MMQKLLRFKQKKGLNLGFTTLEVLVSIIIALAFVSVTMQSFVLAVAMRVKAQEKQRANQLIQEDLERLSDLASIIPEDHENKCNPIATAATGSDPAKTAYENGYAYELWEDIDLVIVPPVNLLSDGNGSKKLELKRFHINDTTDPSPPEDAPYRTLKINYQVKELDSSGNPTGNLIAQRYVEVIPDVALRCP